VCLVARHLEANGLPTLVLGSAYDILIAGRPPRAAFVDYPLGHSAGKPFDASDQHAVVAGALAGFASLDVAGQIVTLPNRWADDGWRAEASSTAAGDTRQPRDDSPQWQCDDDRDAARATGQY
jgi:hypothetical protein